MADIEPEPGIPVQHVLRRNIVRFVISLILLIIYVSYLGFIISSDRGPVDYETFMEIGERLLNHQPVFGENSYYPMPYVMVFAFFAWLPRPLSMIVWFLVPVFAVLIIHRGKPGLLVFAPVLSHFLGGQTALPGMLGLWGYRSRQEPENLWGGIWLAFMTLKPQLALFPVGWALWQWMKYFRSCRRIPVQAWSFLGTFSVIYLPSFLLFPDWINQWLGTPRPLFERALAGFLPRTLQYLLPASIPLYWILLLVLSAGFLMLVWWMNGRKFTFDVFMASSFVIHPLIHDYDLIQMVPLLDTKKLERTALLISIPAILVILFAYQVDVAWYVFTLIPLVIVWQVLQQGRDSDLPSRRTAAGEASAGQ